MGLRWVKVCDLWWFGGMFQSDSWETPWQGSIWDPIGFRCQGNEVIICCRIILHPENHFRSHWLHGLKVHLKWQRAATCNCQLMQRRSSIFDKLIVLRRKLFMFMFKMFKRFATIFVYLCVLLLLLLLMLTLLAHFEGFMTKPCFFAQFLVTV